MLIIYFFTHIFKNYETFLIFFSLLTILIKKMFLKLILIYFNNIYIYMETQNEIAETQNEIMRLIETHMLPYKFVINKVDDMVEDEGYIIKLVNDINEEIGSLHFVITNHTLRQKQGRSTDRQHPEGSEELVIQLRWLGVNQPYLGKNYGILILIYGMCIISKEYPKLLYSIVDDDSDRTDSLKHNIYSKLGFTFDDLTAISHNGKKVEGQGGPEKTAYLGGSFWHDLYDKTYNIINKKDNGGIPLSRKSLSRKVQASKARKSSKSRKAKARKPESKKKTSNVKKKK